MSEFYRKKVGIIEATQWIGGDTSVLDRFCGNNWARADARDEAGPNDAENVVIWNSLERQWLNLPLNHWVIRGIRGELYPCDPDVFERSYELHQ